MSVKDWNAFTGSADRKMANLRKEIPEVATGFHRMAAAAIESGTLDAKTKELIALGIGIAMRCDGCLAYHTKTAARLGASRDEILETISVAIYMGGGPSMIYGADALDAFDAQKRDLKSGA